MLKSTVVEMLCVSKKQALPWGTKGNPVQYDIELQVPYDQKSVFFQQSGGTNQVLKTINQAAADLFEIGETYVMTLTKKVVEPVEEMATA
jgi:hypothetical protein